MRQSYRLFLRSVSGAVEKSRRTSAPRAFFKANTFSTSKSLFFNGSHAGMLLSKKSGLLRGAVPREAFIKKAQFYNDLINLQLFDVRGLRISINLYLLADHAKTQDPIYLLYRPDSSEKKGELSYLQELYTRYLNDMQSVNSIIDSLQKGRMTTSSILSASNSYHLDKMKRLSKHWQPIASALFSKMLNEDDSTFRQYPELRETLHAAESSLMTAGKQLSHFITRHMQKRNETDSYDADEETSSDVTFSC